MDKKLRETTNLYVEIMNSKRQVKGETLGTNSRLPFDVNVMGCTLCCILLHVVGSCYANFEIGQTSSYVKTQHCWPTIVGICWLASVCA